VGPSPQGFFVIGADSLGCNPNAPFVEIELYETRSAHSDKPPASIMSAKEWQSDGQTYLWSFPLAEEPVHRPIYASMGKIMKNIGRQSLISERQVLLDAFKLVMPALEALRMQVLDFDSKGWVDEFHSQLSNYAHIFATDIQARSSINSPLYGQYLREHFAARLKKLGQRSDSELHYCAAVYDAIVCTGWKPDETLWGGHKVVCAGPDQSDELEIVRVLLRDGESDSDLEKWALENLDTDHRLFAAPLFVIDVKKLGAQRYADFALGMDSRNNILQCIEFVPGAVKPVPGGRRGGRRYDLHVIFENLLRNPFLQTVPQYLGRGLMFSDPTKRKEDAENYDRKTSQLTLGELRRLVQPIQTKSRGLDLGCGTGNYTLPMRDMFEHLIGLDASDEMLSVAKKKPIANEVEWMCENALRATLPTDYCDSIWAISSLHYFTREQQRMLFAEIFRLLRSGGRVVIDTEFEEQHGSLWIVEFFPSLKKRYEGRLLSRDLYRTWLNDIGFKTVEFGQLELPADDLDGALRIGQHDPKVYLDDERISGIPAFSEMAHDERLTGRDRLRRAIEDRSIEKVMTKYIAAMPGDIGLIIAQK
jgi:ubiquinone/menaquinone biosynthesis C-methylase UbiE